jgi:hypothetical protein
LIWQVEGHIVMTRHESIAELEHSADAAEAPKVWLDQSDSKPASRARHGS